ncbi:MAG: FtsK/SpoIIIE domain-containing protein, partial [Jatrophihabitantaceae bacterium]
MRIELSVRSRNGPERDVAVSAAEGATLCELRHALAAVACETGEIFSNGRRLAADAKLGGPGLRSGDLLTPDGRERPDPGQGAVLRLHVVGGPDAGRILPLPRGATVLGRGSECDLALDDPGVSRRHAEIRVSGNGLTLRDLGSANGTRVDGARVPAGEVALPPGALIRVGDSFAWVVAAEDEPAALRDAPNGIRLLNRAPRAASALPEREIVIPAGAAGGAPQRVQWIAALVPAAAGGALAVSLHSPQFLLFALLSPVVLLATALGDRIHWRRTRRRAALDHRRAVATAERRIESAITEEVLLRRVRDPDPAAVLRLAAIPGSRLWERRRDDCELLRVRIGLGNVPSSVRLRRGEVTGPAACLEDVPVSVDLRAGPLGVAAPGRVAVGVGRWLLGQLATLCSPADVEFAFLLCEDAAPRWHWARWLPHVRARVASTPAERQVLLAELGQLADQRGGIHRRNRDTWNGRWLVLVVDRVGELSELPGLSALLSHGAAVGITAICLDERESCLPLGCASVARSAGETGSRASVRQPGVDAGVAILDQVSPSWAERSSRALAPLADPGTDAEAALPDSCQLVDLLGLRGATPADLAARWLRSNGNPSTVLGVGVDGPVELDLLRDGPHALVAGTTGAGKSELLQTVVAGLAVTHPPDAICFVLVDYKGGAAFADCARLPHTAGVVTDLDAHLTRRALQSLDCELRLREELFARVNAKDLAGYRALAAGEPVPRLVLVIDEFAALAEELPDFVSGLVAIAQRGRSLGVHLILATQRPGGVVSPEIRANTALRIALRVTDPGESSDVIDSPAAAAIDRRLAGRAYLRAGSPAAAVQTARVAGPAATAETVRVSVARLEAWRRPESARSLSEDGRSDLHLLVDAAREAWLHSGGREVRRPWLAPLAATLPIDTLQASAASLVPVALLDLPGTQEQVTFGLDLAAGASLLVAGGPRSGRTSALVTLAGSAAARWGPDRLHVYAIDCAGGALGPVGRLPHCATAVGCTDFATVETLLRRLRTEASRRQAWLARLGMGSAAEAAAAGQRLPFMLCLVDGWEALYAAAEEFDAGRSHDILLDLLRSGPAVGLSIALSGDRSTLAPRFAGAVTEKLVLRLADRSDYGAIGIAPRAVADPMPPGRAIRARDGAELQFGHLGGAPSRAEQEQMLAELAGHWPDAKQAGGRPGDDRH